MDRPFSRAIEIRTIIAGRVSIMRISLSNNLISLISIIKAVR
jgi:hypothetical protein